jgi:predicted RNase H-like nuclease (RuvC/YqgF family)
MDKMIVLQQETQNHRGRIIELQSKIMQARQTIERLKEDVSKFEREIAYEQGVLKTLEFAGTLIVQEQQTIPPKHPDEK